MRAKTFAKQDAVTATGSARAACMKNKTKYRGVAQLVARVLWEHDAAGSSPVTSTTESRTRAKLGCGFLLVGVTARPASRRRAGGKSAAFAPQNDALGIKALLLTKHDVLCGRALSLRPKKKRNCDTRCIAITLLFCLNPYMAQGFKLFSLKSIMSPFPLRSIRVSVASKIFT